MQAAARKQQHDLMSSVSESFFLIAPPTADSPASGDARRAPPRRPPAPEAQAPPLQALGPADPGHDLQPEPRPGGTDGGSPSPVGSPSSTTPDPAPGGGPSAPHVHGPRAGADGAATDADAGRGRGGEGALGEAALEAATVAQLKERLYALAQRKEALKARFDENRDVIGDKKRWLKEV